MTPEARFADTHARVGLIAGWGLGARLSRAVGLARAKELSLTGNFLSAATAYEWGLVNRVVAVPARVEADNCVKQRPRATPALHATPRQLPRAEQRPHSPVSARAARAGRAAHHRVLEQRVEAHRLAGVHDETRLFRGLTFEF